MIHPVDNFIHVSNNQFESDAITAMLADIDCEQFLYSAILMSRHRWPKRNITGSPVHNMRVCIGEIEFET